MCADETLIRQAVRTVDNPLREISAMIMISKMRIGATSIGTAGMTIRSETVMAGVISVTMAS